MIERLGHRVPAGRRRDEAAERRGSSAASHDASVGPRSHEIRLEVAALGVRPIALRVDPLVPVVERRRRRLLRHQAGPRIDPGGLVEVGVDGEAAAGHGRAAASAAATLGATATVATLLDPERGPLAGCERDRADEQDGAALVDELEAGLGVRDALDRGDPGADRPVGRRLERHAELLVAGRSRSTLATTSRSSWAIRRPSTSWKAAGLCPPPRSMIANSMPSSASRAPPRCSRPRPRRPASGRAARHRSGSSCGSRPARRR